MPSTCEATVFYDDAGEASARIYALAAPTIDGRLLTVDELAACRLECRVEGPKCRYSTTLPTRVKLTHRGVTNWGDLPALVAETYLPDPCHWSPELPFLYRVIGEVRCGERVIAEIDQTFGIRPISVVRNRIKFQGKTWVPRGVNRGFVCEPDLQRWRETATTMLINEADDPSDEFLDEVGAAGIFLCFRFEDEDADALRKSVMRLSRFPAVAFILTADGVAKSILPSARNTLYISHYDATTSTVSTEIGLQRVEAAGFGAPWPRDSSRPLIAYRPIGVPVAFNEARQLCDELQRDLAGQGDPAGYFV